MHVLYFAHMSAGILMTSSSMLLDEICVHMRSHNQRDLLSPINLLGVQLRPCTRQSCTYATLLLRIHGAGGAPRQAQVLFAGSGCSIAFLSTACGISVLKLTHGQKCYNALKWPFSARIKSWRCRVFGVCTCPVGGEEKCCGPRCCPAALARRATLVARGGVAMPQAISCPITPV